MKSINDDLLNLRLAEIKQPASYNILHPDKLRDVAHEKMDAVIEEYKPDAVYSLFSGGTDSLVTTHTMMQHEAVNDVLHIKTGIGISDTFDFVRDTCSQFGWPLTVREPVGDGANLNYEQMVMKHGFPGPGAHRYPYVWLKERQLVHLHRELREAGRMKILLITGVRSQESARRMGHVQTVKREGRRIWFAPLHDWSDGDIERAKVIYSLPHNPVKDIMHFSGECCCGAFAGQRHGSRDAELEAIHKCDPKCADKIFNLQKQATAAGVHDKWGVRPPKKALLEVQDAPIQEMPMCSGCVMKTPVELQENCMTGADL